MAGAAEHEHLGSDRPVDENPGGQPLGQFDLYTSGWLGAEGFVHDRLQGLPRSRSGFARLTGPGLGRVVRSRQALVPDVDHMYLHAPQLRLTAGPPHRSDRGRRTVDTHQDSSAGGEESGWHNPTFLAISVLVAVSTLGRARTAEHAGAT